MRRSRVGRFLLQTEFTVNARSEVCASIGGADARGPGGA